MKTLNFTLRLFFIYISFINFTLEIGEAFDAQNSCSKVFKALGAVFNGNLSNDLDKEKFLKQENAKLNQVMKGSLNRDAIENRIKKLKSKEKILKTTQLKDGSSLELINEGLGNGIKLVLKNKFGNQVREYSPGKKEKRAQRYRIVNFEVSDSEKFLVITWVKNGSINVYFNDIYEVSSGELKGNNILSNYVEVGFRTTEYFSDHKEDCFVFTTYDNLRNLKVLNYIISSGKYVFDPQFSEIVIFKPKYIIGYNKSGALEVVSRAAPYSTKYSNAENTKFEPAKYLGESADYIFMKVTSDDGRVSVDAFLNPLSKSISKFFFAPNRKNILQNQKFNFEKIVLNEKYLFAIGYYGPNYQIRIYNSKDYSFVKSIDAPLGSKIGNIKLLENFNEVELFISNSIKEISLKYNVVDQDKLDPEKIIELNSYENLLFETSLLWATSSDGIEIPFTIMSLQGIEKKGDNPVLIRSYGGFSSPGYIYGGLDLMNIEFLTRGGILVGPALRGGNEFGTMWSHKNRGTNLLSTAEDLIAVTKALIDLKYTNSSKIISTGSSMGALTAVSAALKYPDQFGLIVARNGRYDYRERVEEGKDNRVLFGFENKSDMINSHYISPNQLAKQITHIPKMLLILGRKDTRVPKSGSLSLAWILRNNKNIDQSQLHLLSQETGGHLNYSILYQDYVGLRNQVYEWSLIFDYLNWEISP